MLWSLLWMTWLAVGGPDSAAAPVRLSFAPAPGGGVTSDAGLRVLRAHVEGGMDAELPWADFRDLRPELTRFYARRGWTLAWVRDGRPTDSAWMLATTLAAAAQKGLDPPDFGGESWEARLGALEGPAASEPERVRADVALTVSALRYAGDLALGRIRPVSGTELLGRIQLLSVREPPVDLVPVVEAAADAADPESILTQVEPTWPDYRRTLTLLGELRARAGDEPPGDLESPGPDPIAPEGYGSVDRLAARLLWLGVLDGAHGGFAAAGEPACASPLAEALARFQERHGLDPTGFVDEPTVRELNVPLARRLEQLALSLERWRWVPRSLGASPILVNVPEFRLRASEGARSLSMRVVVGQAWRWGTPVFADRLTLVIFRPTWKVPLPIQREELVARIEADPGFTAASDLEVLDASEAVVPPPSTPGLLAALRSGALRLRQRAGASNALGLVKFAFPNAGWIYLHGTPAQELFSRTRRDFSHGCIRVEDPVALAEWVLRDEPRWPPAAIRRAMHGDRTLEVNLPRPVPVIVGYFTAVAGEEGEPRFFEDLYGHDAALASALRDEAIRRRGVEGGR